MTLEKDEKSIKKKDNRLKNLINNLDKKEIASVVAEIHDLFLIYLDTDLAADNDERRNKVAAVEKVKEILRVVC